MRVMIGFVKSDLWSPVEKHTEKISSTPIQAILADRNLHYYINTSTTDKHSQSMEIPKTIIKDDKLEWNLVLLKWCACQTLQTNRLDNRFRDWTAKGITVFKTLKGDLLPRFET